jgi:hypothetical protein
MTLWGTLRIEVFEFGLGFVPCDQGSKGQCLIN